MHIGIIGAGNVGGALGKRWAQAGHSICFGVPDAASEKTRRTVREIGKGAIAGTVREAAKFGETIALAAPWGAVQEAIRNAGDLEGKTLLDCTNPLSEDFMSLAVSGNTSGAEQVASWAKGAKVVKVFNTTGFNNMLEPRYGEESTFMPYCSDHADAKKIAHDLATEIGFNAVDCGPLAEARLLEPMALVWIHLAIQNNDRDIAFHLLRRRG